MPKPPVAAIASIEHDALPGGTRFGEFEILRVLGVGGFGIVYLAHDHSLERDVALKEYMPAALASRGAGPMVTIRAGSFAETYAIGLRSFINESRMLARFDHPSLVKVYRFWEDNGTAYMVMPYLQGRTLRDVRRAHGDAPDEAWIRNLLAPLLDALELLHREGVFHRDIAPDNILLLPDGSPILLDFGAARRVIGDRTQSLTAILKPSYAPIEQYAEMASLRQGPWTDLYALGAVLHYLVFGVPPAPATARAVQADDEGIERRAVPGVSPRFLQVVAWMLGVRPVDRPQDVAAVRAALLGGSPIPTATRQPSVGPSAVHSGHAVMARVPDVFAATRAEPRIRSAMRADEAVSQVMPPRVVAVEATGSSVPGPAADLLREASAQAGGSAAAESVAAAAELQVSTGGSGGSAPAPVVPPTWDPNGVVTTIPSVASPSDAERPSRPGSSAAPLRSTPPGAPVPSHVPPPRPRPADAAPVAVPVPSVRSTGRRGWLAAGAAVALSLAASTLWTLTAPDASTLPTIPSVADASGPAGGLPVTPGGLDPASSPVTSATSDRPDAGDVAPGTIAWTPVSPSTSPQAASSVASPVASSLDPAAPVTPAGTAVITPTAAALTPATDATAPEPGASASRDDRRPRAAAHRAASTRSTPAPPTGPLTAREACGDRRFIALAICIDRECERPRFRATPECVRVLEVKQRRAER